MGLLRPALVLLSSVLLTSATSSSAYVTPCCCGPSEHSGALSRRPLAMAYTAAGSGSASGAERAAGAGLRGKLHASPVDSPSRSVLSPMSAKSWLNSSRTGRRKTAATPVLVAMHMARGGGSSSGSQPLAVQSRVRGGGAAEGSVAASRFGFVSAWGVLSVVAILGNALKRLAPHATQPFSQGDFSSFHWALYGGFSLLMAYVEGVKGFQKKFSPLVVKRALTLDKSAGPLRVVLAGPYSMGLFHASKRRLIVSWCLTGGVFCLVQLVKKLPYPWRSIVDAGVVTGLSWGTVSILAIWVKSWFGTPPTIDPALP